MALAAELKASPQPWTVDPQRRVAGLEVALLKQTYVLPWSQFLYAEGTFDQVRAVFTTHDVLIAGTGLSSLLSDFAAQHIIRLQEPPRSEKFISAAGPRITALTVKTAESAKD